MPRRKEGRFLRTPGSTGGLSAFAPGAVTRLLRDDHFDLVTLQKREVLAADATIRDQDIDL